MRSPERIERILATIKDIWKKDPDVRFMQLIYILQAKYSEKNNGIGKIEKSEEDGFCRIGYDLFHIEDTDFEDHLHGHLKEKVTTTNKSEQNKFYERLLFHLTLAGRAIWSDENLNQAEILEDLKWLNEINHRLLNAINDPNSNYNEIISLVQQHTDNGKTLKKHLEFSIKKAWSVV